MRGDLVRQSLGLMQAVGVIGSMLTRLPANREHPGVCAGLTFTVSRTELTYLTKVTDSFALGERFGALAQRLEQLTAQHPALHAHAKAMRDFERFWRERYASLAGKPADAPKPPAAAPAPTPAAPAPAKPPEILEGREAVLIYDGKRCIHSRGCVLGEPGVFIANKPGEWIYPDAATPERLSLVAINCPSGAITVRRKDGVQEVPPPVNVVRVRENGPLAFHADMDIVGHPPGEVTPYRATLCRCGRSGNKPFCDGSHNAAQFQATGEPLTRESQPLAARNGPLQVQPLRNGPLEVTGSLELCAGTGRTVDRLTAIAPVSLRTLGQQAVLRWHARGGGVRSGRGLEFKSRRAQSEPLQFPPGERDMQALTPARIMEVGMGFWPAKTLLSAVELGVFTTLSSSAMTGEELRIALGLHPRAVPDFLDALVALRFLDRDADGPGARYRNTAETALFLDRASPNYIAGILEMANARLYRFWGDLTEALRTGKPQNEIKRGGKSMFEELYREPKRLEQFMDAMAGISGGNFTAFAEKFDFSRYATLCDVGGATGLLSIIVAQSGTHTFIA